MSTLLETAKRIKQQKILEEQGGEEFEVEKILDKQVIEGITYYLVKWQKLPEKDATWEPMENLDNCSEVIEEFEKFLTKRRQELLSGYMKLKNLPHQLHRNSKKINKIHYQGKAYKMVREKGGFMKFCK